MTDKLATEYRAGLMGAEDKRKLGDLEPATAADIEAGTSDKQYVTPKALKEAGAGLTYAAVQRFRT